MTPTQLRAKRAMTQTIAADVHDRHGAAAIRFPSRLDGNACLVVFEDRGRLEVIAEPIALTDPAPLALQTVRARWRLALDPRPRLSTTADDHGCVG